MKYACALVLLGMVTGGAQSARADCFCACVEGVEKTVCDDITEASVGLNLCLSGHASTSRLVIETVSQWGCPDPEGAIDPDVSETPPAGAENCVRVRIFDPVTGSYTATRNICDVAG